MPGNTISINESKDLVWYVPDSKIPQLIGYLSKLGVAQTEKAEELERTELNKLFEDASKKDVRGVKFSDDECVGIKFFEKEKVVNVKESVQELGKDKECTCSGDCKKETKIEEAAKCEEDLEKIDAKLDELYAAKIEEDGKKVDPEKAFKMMRGDISRGDMNAAVPLLVLLVEELYKDKNKPASLMSERPVYY